jgi:hypothetical protein
LTRNCCCLVGILLHEELERYLRSLLPPFLRIMMISSPKYRMFVNQRWGLLSDRGANKGDLLIF